MVPPIVTEFCVVFFSHSRVFLGRFSKQAAVAFIGNKLRNETQANQLTPQYSIFLGELTLCGRHPRRFPTTYNAGCACSSRAIPSLITRQQIRIYHIALSFLAYLTRLSQLLILYNVEWGNHNLERMWKGIF